jgi:Flp pilus assembly protein TadD
VEAHNHIAWLLATSTQEDFRNGERALAHARRAVSLEPSANTMDTLAAAYAELGQWDAAISTQRQALGFIAAGEEPDVTAELEARLAAYQARKAWRE